jgi:hypothetical protein
MDLHFFVVGRVVIALLNSHRSASGEQGDISCQVAKHQLLSGDEKSNALPERSTTFHTV